MLSTLLISLPANLDLFFGFGLSENLSDGGTTRQSERQVGFPLLSSEPVTLDAVRSLDGLCLLVHCRLY